MGYEEIRLAILERKRVMAVEDSQRALLRECVLRQAPELAPLLTKIGSAPLSDPEREKLRGALAAELSDTGLDLEGGHSERGVALDDLIDLLGHV